MFLQNYLKVLCKFFCKIAEEVPKNTEMCYEKIQRDVLKTILQGVL